MNTPTYDMESALIGCIATDEGVYARVAPLVSSEDLHVPINRQIFAAAAQLHHEGHPVDPLLLLQRVGEEHVDYLRQLIELTPTVTNAELYAQEIRNTAIRAKIQAVGAALAVATSAPEINRHLMALQALQAEATLPAAGTKVITLAESMAAYLDPSHPLAAGSKPDVPTGCRALDQLLGGGLRSGNVHVVGAHTSVGKTTLALSIAASVASRGGGVLFVSLETPHADLRNKLIARHTDINSMSISNRHLTPNEYERVAEAIKVSSEHPLYFLDNFGAKVEDIRTAAMNVQGLELLVIDYIGLLVDASCSSRYVAMTAVSRAIKLLAHDLGVPILAISQLRREYENGYDVEPKLTDLRDSGAIEQDADVVIMLWRGQRRKNPDDPDELNISVAKNRHGSTTKGVLAFRPEISRFYGIRHEPKDN